MGNAVNSFASIFKALTEHEPFPWQEALFGKFAKGEIPDSCCLPTGLGKTNVMAVWLIALAQSQGKLFRRLVYVVNRRTVVDQATREAEKLRDRLPQAGLVEPLRELCALPHELPLAVSTLRGQFADKGEWMADPSRPAIIVGTVDMIGSRLLFNGYGRGFKTRPLHAGFLGQDTVVIHDEAHLEPAFQTLLEEIQAEQQGSDVPPSRSRDLKPIRILALTATTRSGAAPFSLTDDDRENQWVKQRIEAVKRLSLVAKGKTEKLEDWISDSVTTKKLPGAVLVFVRSVETALKIVAALDKGENKGRVLALTGTMRGKERDELVNDPRFQRFLGGNVAQSGHPVFLVCTSAGEVGINISADHCVCDLSTYESMAQRFGRVNRFGKRLDSTITVVHDTEFETEDKNTGPLESAREATLALLKRLPKAGPGVYDASPAALESLPAAARAAAFSPPPELRVATPIQFDAWALTSIREPIAARPPVAPYLHGEAEWQPSETHVAWRADCDFTYNADLAEFVDKFPLRPHELLRDTTKRIVATLDKMLAAKTELTTALLISEDGSVSPFPLRDFDKKDAESALANATLILPVSLGGFEKGLFTGKGDASDVSGIERRDSPVRDATADLVLDIGDEYDEEPRFLHWFAPSDAQAERPSAVARGSISLAEHTAAVVANARAIAAKLNLSAEVQSAIVAAAEHHDGGKARLHWQRAIGNRDYPKTILAKPAGNTRSLAENYRHEFGSLALLADAEFTDDLAAHIVAAHHGRARPHFPADEIFDPERSPRESMAVACDVPQRFASLQHKYGRWGLAYLESILRAADYAASAGFVAKAPPPLQAASSPAGPSVLPPRGTGCVSLALDPANPGHYFACCGLFELASRLYPEATAHFEGNRFIIYAPTTLADLFDKIATTEIRSVNDSVEIDEDTEEDDESEAESEKEAAAPPLLVSSPFNIRLDWWITQGKSDTSALKVWAGSMKVLRIANAMLVTLHEAIGTDSFDCGNVLFDTRTALDPIKIRKGEAKTSDQYAAELKTAQERRDETLKKAREEKTGAKLEMATEKIARKYREFCAKAEVKRNRSLEQLRLRSKTEPFYFDAKRGPNADSRDVGFSPNDLKLKTLAAPAVEFLCLVGLQRAIPRPAGDKLFDYHLWTGPIPISLVAAAVNGLIQPQPHLACRFESWYRTSQRKHKAFLTAKPITQGDAT
jgi:CRISPR-associated endonuclease/helicase Cas3